MKSAIAGTSFRWVVGPEHRFSQCGPMHLDLFVGVTLETFDDQQVDRCHAAGKLGYARLGLAAQFVQQGPAPGVGQQHLLGAQALQAPADVAAAIEGHGMPEPTGDQLRDQPGHQSGLPTAAVTGYAEFRHRPRAAPCLVGSCQLPACTLSVPQRRLKIAGPL
jgi:hypothetical protein